MFLNSRNRYFRVTIEMLKIIYCVIDFRKQIDFGVIILDMMTLCLYKDVAVWNSYTFLSIMYKLVKAYSH